MGRQLRLRHPMELLRVTTGFIKKEVKPVQTSLHPSLLGLVGLRTGPSWMMSRPDFSTMKYRGPKLSPRHFTARKPES
ncbi:hypothetical protein CASFOL_029477 [Castilleja foliolosa]|uniref:Ribosomal protein S19 n=1 Tax=Castilleja foliolosa TaxID=1961234 RepID=A0ABD3CBK9_9LAMI